MPNWDVEIPLFDWHYFDDCQRQRIGESAYVRVIANDYKAANNCVKRYIANRKKEETEP